MGMVKKRTGRPRKRASERRTESVKVLATKNELAMMKAGAQSAGLPLGTWLRLLALQAAEE